MRRRVLAFFTLSILANAQTPDLANAQGVQGYYRQPAIHGNTIVFVSEGDLWKVEGQGVAQRLTSNLAEETQPQISPDGKTIAFTGRFDGVADVYTMPIAGGAPRRHSWDAGAQVVGWTADGRILYTTVRYSTLPNAQLVMVDPRTNAREVVKLAQAWDGSFDGSVLFFTRQRPAAQSTRLYTGGTAQNIWKWDGSGEAVCLTCDWKGTSRSAKVWNGRVYFLSDRADKTMNIWSMDFAGKDLRQHTQHRDYEVREFSMHDGRIAYQQGADIHVLDVSRAEGAQDAKVRVTVATDLDQLRERWVKRPMDFLTDFHIDKTGEKVSLIARGVVFIAPVEQGRFVQLPNRGGVRYRDMRFSPDGKSVYTLNDRSGEVELWQAPANGVGEGVQLTKDAQILRWDLEVSPDNKYIAHDDKNQKLWLYDQQARSNKLIAESKYGGFSYWWTPDAKSVLYHTASANSNQVIYRYDVATGTTSPLTTDRFSSYSPVVTPDGVWLYFLSDRTFNTSVGSPWGAGAPDPYFNNQTKIYAIQLKRGPRFAFAPKTELDTDTVEARSCEITKLRNCELYEVPVPAGNYSSLATDGKRLYLTSRPDRFTGAGAKVSTIEFTNDDAKLETFAEGVSGFELSGDAKKILFRKGQSLYVVPAGAKAPTDLAKSEVDLSGWQMQLERKEELQNLFVDAWRLERDYFYDPGMHGLDWNAIRKKYEPLAARVNDRSELNDVVSQMVAELSALHINVRGGDLRASADTIAHSSLGAVLTPADGGWQVTKIYRNDPDIVSEQSPLARPGVGVSEGDVIVAINGVPLTGVQHPAELLMGKAGKQVLLEISGGRRAIVNPISINEEFGLRYSDWEYSRKQMVDRLSGGRIGYIHIRAMGSSDMDRFARDYYPQYNKDALIIDVRHNGGGNIDSWLLAKLMRKPWMWWQPRVGEPYANMQYAFNGPMATIVNEWSGSDGEIFPEGFRRLGLGPIIGVRTWGGEIWLTSSNVLADRGIATAAEFGVYADGKWLIEQHGVEPDVVVDNLPFATFAGNDAQLEATVRALMGEVGKRKPGAPVAPGYPKKTD